MITTNEAFSILAGWQENNTDLEVLEYGGSHELGARAHCIIVAVDRKAETVTVLYESPAEPTGEHCFDLREALFFFGPNAAQPTKTALVAEFASHLYIFFVER